MSLYYILHWLFWKKALRKQKQKARIKGFSRKHVGKAPAAAEKFEGKNHRAIITTTLITYDKESITPFNCFQRFEISKNNLWPAKTMPLWSYIKTIF